MTKSTAKVKWNMQMDVATLVFGLVIAEQAKVSAHILMVVGMSRRIHLFFDGRNYAPKIPTLTNVSR